MNPNLKPLLGLTEPQRELYNWLCIYIQENKRPPSYRQMAKAMNLRSVAAVQARLKRLQRHGLIVLIPREARSVSIVEKPTAA
jgi:repressor LexA